MNSEKSVKGESLIILLGISVPLLNGCANSPDLYTNRAVYVTSGIGSDQQISTLNGPIDLGRGTSSGTLTSFNGDITIGEQSHIDGALLNLNGEVTVGGGDIYGDVITTNGNIDLHDTTVSGDVESFNGRITVENSTLSSLVATNGSVKINNSVIENSLIVHKRSPWMWNLGVIFKKPVIDIGRNSEIKGDIIINRKVTLYVHDTAKIGNVYGAEIISYSGDKPLIQAP